MIDFGQTENYKHIVNLATLASIGGTIMFFIIVIIEYVSRKKIQ